MMKNKQSQASIKYDKNNTKRIFIKLNINSDKDILEYLETKSNKQGYIKDLIRNEIRATK